MIFSTSMASSLRLIVKRLMMPLFRLLWLRKEVLRLRLIFSILSVICLGIRIKSVKNCSVISIPYQRIMPSVMMICVLGKNSILVLLTLLELLALLSLFLMLLLMSQVCILITAIAPVRRLLLSVTLKLVSNVLILTFAAMKKAKQCEEKGGDFHEKTETD